MQKNVKRVFWFYFECIKLRKENVQKYDVNVK